MNMNKMLRTLLLSMLLLFAWAANAQTTFSGTVVDESGEPLIGASVVIKGTVVGTTTDIDGNFVISTSQAPPFTILVSYTGYGNYETEVTASGQKVNATLSEGVQMQEIVVSSASRRAENIMQSPVSIEKMDVATIKNTASANFYDAIENLNGVQMGTNSLTFKSVNTRGFAGLENTRFVQVIDGMDNAAPGLNFSPGNLVGISELDVNSIELVPGAASALYGPNAFNGILFINSKDPFLNPGLSVMLKGGATNQKSGAGTNPFGEFGIRYAHKVNDKFAFKLNFSALQGTDWWANDTRHINGDEVVEGYTGPDYDGVNLYGDEIATTLELGGQSVKVARTGYAEKDLVDDDYQASTYKADAALHYKVGKNAELVYNYRFGAGQAVYQAANRNRLRDINLQQHKLELRGDNYFLRGYTTIENAGDSYDTKFLAWNINRSWKSDVNWFTDYALAYQGAPASVADLLLGYGTATGNTNMVGIGTQLKTITPGSHSNARLFADNNLNSQLSLAEIGALSQYMASVGLPAQTIGLFQYMFNRNDKARLLPGTDAYESTKYNLSYLADLKNGSKFIDKSALRHVEGGYNFAELLNNALDLQVGANFRQYDLNSEGTIFNDGPDGVDKLLVNEYGAYLQASKGFLADEALKLTVSARYDKNENFEGKVSPRAAVVYSFGENKRHNLRASYQTGFRNPTNRDQYISLDIGVATLVGGAKANIDNYSLDVLNNNLETVTINGSDLYGNAWAASSVSDFAATGDPTKLVIDNSTYVAPEQLTVYEVGYKGMLAKNLFFDVSYYYNQYENFIAGVDVVVPLSGNVKDGSGIFALLPTSVPGGTNAGYRAFRKYSNSNAEVTSMGLGGQLEYLFGKGFRISANANWAKFDYDETIDPDFRPEFNTPDIRFNIGFGNADIYKGLGFNVNYRYTGDIFWDASFARGTIPAYDAIDLQLSYKIKPMKTTVKAGVANLLNKEYVTGIGSARIGSQYFLSLTYDELFR
jgi:iron complex outermembrane receptor protein